MEIFLETIAFNHGDPTTTGNLSIRRNATQIVPLPEWKRESCSCPECAPAAYVLCRLPKILTIKARFSSPDVKNKDVPVQALAREGDVLGPAPQTAVSFDANGQTQPVTFQLPGARLSQGGVSANTIEWSWQFPIKDGWKTFQTTQHRIYCVQCDPKEPWLDGELPWTEVLEVACRWAAGMKDVDSVAARITEAVNNLGRTLVKYSSSPTYARDKFHCTPFLKLLRDGLGKGQTINCDDCATIVSTFANVLGCDLSQSGMGRDFHTNEILLIGDTEWKSRGFDRHGAAWKGKCKASDRLYDACLQLQGDISPKTGKAQPVLPINVPFGSPRDPYSYRSRLVRDHCEPRPFEKRRRPLGKSYLGSSRPDDAELLSVLKRRHDFEHWPEGGEESIDPQVSISLEFFRQSDAFEGWMLRDIEEFDSPDLFEVVELLLGRPGEDALVEISLYHCKEDSRGFLLKLMTEFHQSDVVRVADGLIGDVGFQEPGSKAVVFKRRRFVAFLRSVGKSQVSCEAMSIAIDGYFTSVR